MYPHHEVKFSELREDRSTLCSGVFDVYDEPLIYVTCVNLCMILHV